MRSAILNFSRRFKNLQSIEASRLRQCCHITATIPPHIVAKVKHVHHFSSSSRPRSPYAILNLKTSATEDDIKTAFRNVSLYDSSFPNTIVVICTQTDDFETIRWLKSIIQI